jgi:TetR/AcrR family transcriptional regulator, transcriptional repressor of bet genes
MAAHKQPSRISQERRRDLIDAAISSIAAVGYNDVTVQSICEAAGFSRGLIGHYFAGKDELLLHAVRQVAQELEEATRAAVEAVGPNALERLHAVVEASFSEPSFTAERVSVWVALAGTARWSPPLAEVYRELWRSYRAAIQRLMLRAAEERGVTLDADRAALTFSRLIEGFYIGWADDPVAVTPAGAKAACHEFLELRFSR